MTAKEKISLIFRPANTPGIQTALTRNISTIKILEWVLDQTGAANIDILTFSVNEETCIRIKRLKESGQIKYARLAADAYATRNSRLTAMVAENAFDVVKFLPNHAKAIVVRPDNSTPIIITGSQNAASNSLLELAILISGEDAERAANGIGQIFN